MNKQIQSHIKFLAHQSEKNLDFYEVIYKILEIIPSTRQEKVEVSMLLAHYLPNKKPLQSNTLTTLEQRNDNENNNNSQLGERRIELINEKQMLILHQNQVVNIKRSNGTIEKALLGGKTPKKFMLNSTTSKEYWWLTPEELFSQNQHLRKDNKEDWNMDEIRFDIAIYGEIYGGFTVNPLERHRQHLANDRKGDMILVLQNVFIAAAFEFE
uniref:Uncharacterized protein n=1 Tax=Panagrolaimus sp. PS1159 TaxID=55785 RepID=A0AC35GHA7_9BILA